MIVPHFNVTCPSILTLPNCTIDASYTQPGQGMAVIPWIFSFSMLLIHLPLVIARLIHFRSTQLVSIFLAVFSITLTTLTYKSTGRKPEMVYTWATVTTVTIDVGAMIELFAFRLEQEGRGLWGLARETFGCWKRRKVRYAEGWPLMDVPLYAAPLEGNTTCGRSLTRSQISTVSGDTDREQLVKRNNL